MMNIDNSAKPAPTGRYDNSQGWSHGVEHTMAQPLEQNKTTIRAPTGRHEPLTEEARFRRAHLRA
mgnify:CR=1 FL=1